MRSWGDTDSEPAPTRPTLQQRFRQWLLRGQGAIIARPLYAALIALELAAERAIDSQHTHASSADPALLQQLTVLIKTFERPRVLARLVNSIRRFYPTLPIIVVDDSREPSHLAGVQTLVLPFNSGLSAGRHLGLAHATTPYVLVLDDDYIFYRHTNLLDAVALIERESQIDILAGELIYLPFYTTIDYRLAPLWPTEVPPTFPAGTSVGGLPVYEKAANFFIARAGRLRLVDWDPQLKLVEHADFFTRARGILTTVFNQKFKCLHAKTPFDHNYMTYRRNVVMELAILYHRYKQ